MRIRKNSKGLVEEKRTSYLVCKLNRSPWDDESFFSQLVEEGWDNCFPLNGSLAHSNLVYDSNPSGDSMELSFEYLEKRELGKEGGEIESVVEAKTTSLCNVTEPPQPPLRKRGRPKKPTHGVVANGDSGGRNGVINSDSNSNSNNNSYSYYYYSGFGPSWSKKRGIVGNNSNKNYNNYNTKRKKYYHNKEEEEEKDGIINIKKSKIEVKNDEFEEEIEYIDDDFDDDDDEDNEENGVRARPRKPVKARSLKSLM